MTRRAVWAAAGLTAFVVAAYAIPQAGSGGGAPTASAAGVCQSSPSGLAPGARVVIPITGPYLLTSNYGPRWGTLHQGIDFAAGGTPAIVAAAAGTVTFAGWAGDAGQMVQIDHGDGIVTKSMHLSRVDVRQGVAVHPGTQIGLQGNTGDSTGPHLHFQVEVAGSPVDPRAWLAAAGIAVPQEGGSGDGSAAGSAPVVSPRSPQCDTAAAGVNEGAIPADYRSWVMKAGQVCREIPASVVAAQIDAESGWNPRAVSPAGAQGLSQFMPGTWAAYGRDDDGNGRVSPYDAGDAIMAQARYDCEIAASLRGVVAGDLLDLTLAGYNAGPGAVMLHGGVPPYAETRAYVAKIRGLASGKYAKAAS